MPAHTKYTVEGMCEAIEKSKGLLTVAAGFIGCNRRTIIRRSKTSKKIKDAIELARNKMGDMAEGMLFTAIKDKERWAIELYLKTQCRDRGYFEKQVLEHTGEQTVTVDKKMPDFSGWDTDDIKKYNDSIRDALQYVEKYKSAVDKDM